MLSPESTIDLTRIVAGSLPTPDALLVALREQQKLIAQQSQGLEKKSAQIQNQKALIAVLEEKLRLMQHRRFGASSEKNVLQDDWLGDEAETLSDGQADADDGELEPESPSDPVERDPKPKPKKPPEDKPGVLDPNLPRVQKFLPLSDAEREGAIETFFVKVKEELDIVPARVQVIEIMQERAVYRDADGERTLRSAERPPHPIGKSIASINLLAWLVIAKYADGLPLYRLEKILARYGGGITRTTLANWIIRLSVTLAPLMARYEHALMASDYIQGDETRLQVLKEPGMEPTGHKWIWLMRGGPPGRTIVMFSYDKSRGGAVVVRLLDRFTGRYFRKRRLHRL